MKKLLLAFGLLGALLSASANEDPQINFSLNNYAETGYIFGGDIGVAWGTRGLLKNAPYDNAYDRTSSGFMGGVLLGYDSALNDYVSLGLETAMQYNYHIAESPHAEKFSILSFPVMAVGKLFIPNTEGVHFIGKAGYAYNRFIIDTPGNRDFDNNIAPVIAIGVGYKYKNTAISLQWQHNWMHYRGKENNFAHVALGLSAAL